MIWRRVAAGALVVGLVVALVVVLWPEAEEPIEPTRPIAKGSSEPTSETPTPSATPSPSPTLVVPTPDTTGRDFDRIFREINDFRNWLYQNPDPALVDLIYHPDCECHAEATNVLARMRRTGLHFGDAESTVGDIRVVEDFQSLARVMATVDSPALIVLNEQDQVVEKTEDTPPTEVNVVLVRHGDGWAVRRISAEP